MPRNLTRVALPEHMGASFDQKGNRQFVVPGAFYRDGEARSFLLPAADLETIGEPAWLVYSHAVYCDSETAVRAGVIAIDNPSRRHKYRGGRGERFNNRG